MKLYRIGFGFLMISIALAADIEAGKMEILNTNEGRVTVFKEGVTIIDRDTKITARNARFYEKKDLAIVYDSVKIVNPSAVVRSETAYYYLNESKTILKGNVSVVQESLKITAPALLVEYQKDLASAKNSFVITEKLHSIQITGATGEYFLNKEEGMIDSLPYLTVNKNETLEVTSQKLSFKNKDNSAEASGKVIAISGKAILYCDTLIYNWAKDSGVAFGKPMLKEDKNEVKGKTFYFFTKEGELQRMEIKDAANGHYYNEENDRIEIGGELLGLLFSEGKTNSISVKNLTLGKLYRRGEKD